ncbi:MAG TPA: AraC family transcriptional regulator [Aliidongia sp.]|nr:AraC family transcriptional regulator [Aliidongia sp.]
MSLPAAILPFPSPCSIPRQPDFRAPMIQPEVSWMRAPSPCRAADASRIRIGRWARSELSQLVEHVADHEEPAYTISYCLRQQQVHLTSGSQIVIPSTILAGHVLLQSPTAEVRRGRFDSGYHVLRIYLPADMIAESYEEATGRAAPKDLALFDPYVTSDQVLENLARSLINVETAGGIFGPTFVDGVGMALAARLVALSLSREPSSEKSSSPLAKWRLKKVVAYLEEHFHEPLYLSDLSTVAGLSQSHFTRQFRLATGFTPNAYILKRRIEAAQNLLLDREKPIAWIALEVGFPDQARFSSIFKKVVGASPRQWRAAVTSH